MRPRSLAVLDAPSNLGLRPPGPGSVPGCYKQPWALRDRGLLDRLNAHDAGAVAPGRYQAAWRAGSGDRNAPAIAAFSRALADRVGRLLDDGRWPLVVGGDCSILLGDLLALKRRGRYGLVFMDAHSDFRHPGNAPAVGAAAGEDLALVTGRGDARLVDLDGLGPSLRDDDVVIVGIRPNDEDRAELKHLGIPVITSTTLRRAGAVAAARRVLKYLSKRVQGFWIHLDWDVVDQVEMPAADCPEPNGLTFKQTASFLRTLVRSPRCAGLEVTIYDPDLDPQGVVAERIVACLETVFGGARS